MNLLNRLKLAQKFALVLLLILLPTTYLTVQYVGRLQQQIGNDRDGLEGLRYLRGLRAAVVPVTRHHALAVGAVAAGGDTTGRLPDALRLADEAFATFEQDQRAAGPADPYAQRGEELRREWVELRGSWSRMTAAEVDARHAALIAKMQRFIDDVAAAHMLNRGLDDTMLQMKLVVADELPDAQVALGQLRAVTVTMAASKAPVTDAQLIQMGRASGALEGAFARISHSLEVASAHPTSGAPFGALASGAAADGGRAVHDLAAWLADAAHVGRPVPFGVLEVLDRGFAVVKALEAIQKGAAPALDEAMAQRLAASERARTIGLASVAVMIVFAVALGFVIARAILAGMRQAVGVFGRIQQGHFDNAIVVPGRDEVGQVLKGLSEMQAKLKEQIERDRKVAAENGRVRTALDKVTTNVMLADADGTIIYMNEAVQAMFRSTAAEIRKQLPGFDPERILGSSFDQFHRNPAHQRNLLGTLTQTHSSEMKLGNATLKIVANPVVDAQGVRLGTAVQWFDRTQEVATEEEVNGVVQAALDGDLVRRIREQGKTGFFAALAGGMNRLLDTMAGVVQTIKTAANEVSSGADEISRGNANLSQRTEEQASSLEETASSMEEMTATVRQNADSAQQANQLAIAARGQAERGGRVVAEAVVAMNAINASSKKIADIIGVIDEIAFQTNLLALNAAVEAARAGEQGRGFAVVASEVRNLASRSAEAAKEIKALIQDSVGKVGEGAKLVDESGRTLAEIVSSVKKVTDIVAEIAAASNEQSAGIEQVNKAVTSMDEVTQQNAALVEEAAAAAEALMQQAQALTVTMAHYRTEGAGSASATPSRSRAAA
jgi:methyl-accepting chemotaxis protein